MGNEPAPKTQEQIDAEKFLQDHGLEEGVLTAPDNFAVVPPETPAETPPAPPAAPATPPAPPATPPAPAAPAITAEELEKLRKRAEWADHEKERADRFRQDAERQAAENDRLRQALGVPQPPQPKKRTFPTKEEEEADVRGRTWLKEKLVEDGILAEAIISVPEDVLAKHPAIVRRDVYNGKLRDQLDQANFLMEFDPKQRSVIKKRILPGLSQRRAAVGYQKTYEELWEDEKTAAKEAAEVYGIVTGVEQTPTPAPPPAPGIPPVLPPTTVPVARVVVPPSALSVPGASTSPTTPPPRPYTSEELRVMGLADGPFSGA